MRHGEGCTRTATTVRLVLVNGVPYELNKSYAAGFRRFALTGVNRTAARHPRGYLGSRTADRMVASPSLWTSGAQTRQRRTGAPGRATGLNPRHVRAASISWGEKGRKARRSPASGGGEIPPQAPLRRTVPHRP